MIPLRTRRWLLLGTIVLVAGATLPAVSGEDPLETGNDANTGFDAGDRPEAATMILEGTYQGGLGPLDTQDWYLFEAPASTHVCVTWRGLPLFLVSVWPSGALYDENGERRGGEGCTDSAIRSMGMESGEGGRYLLRFTSSINARYEFTVNVDPCGEHGNATLSAADATVPTPLPPPPPPPAPVLAAVEPARGAPGTAFALAGSFFQPGATVTFGDVQAKVSEVTSDQILGTVPALEPGTYAVTVTNPDGLVATLEGAFEATLTADPALGELVIERRNVQPEGGPGTSTALDMRRVTATVVNLGYGPTTAPLRVEAWAEPDGRAVPFYGNMKLLGRREVAALESGESATLSFVWDPKGQSPSFGDYVVRVRLVTDDPQLSLANDEVTARHSVGVTGLGGL